MRVGKTAGNSHKFLDNSTSAIRIKVAKGKMIFGLLWAFKVQRKGFRPSKDRDLKFK
jgi:hypothetical protein